MKNFNVKPFVRTAKTTGGVFVLTKKSTPQFSFSLSFSREKMRNAFANAVGPKPKKSWANFSVIPFSRVKQTAAKA